MSDVDQLISELFPRNISVSTDEQNQRELPASQTNWDLSDDENCSIPVIKGPLDRIKDNAEKYNSGANHFDESDDDDKVVGSQVVPSLTVSFPSFPSNLLGACQSRCFVTNIPAEHLHHPSLAELLLVGEGKYNTRSTVAQLMERKGAFHAYNPKVGNGARDKYEEGAREHGGCPMIVCRRCNYAVIRLQGAAWQDGNGTIDLYLTMRNYYPDWSCLATSFPVGQAGSKEYKRVLRANLGCAAYCCQCSWLTVKSPVGMIETKLTDHSRFVGKEIPCCFATVLPLPEGERRRPPLWLCRGHVDLF